MFLGEEEALANTDTVYIMFSVPFLDLSFNLHLLWYSVCFVSELGSAAGALTY